MNVYSLLLPLGPFAFSRPIREAPYDPAEHIPVDRLWGVGGSRLPILAAEVGVDLEGALVLNPDEGPLGCWSLEVSALERILAGRLATKQERAAIRSMLEQAEWRAGPGVLDPLDF